MATMNPLEKKARSSFIKGILIAGLIGILGMGVLGFFIFQMNGKEKARIAAQKQVLVLNKDVKGGDEVTIGDLTTTLANAEVATTGALSMNDFLSMVSDEDGNELAVKVVAKISIPSKSIITTDMLVLEEEKVTDDLREQEFNMIILPTDLEDGDTIDIRFRLPSGENYIVLPKKRVSTVDLGGTLSAQTIKLNVNESETLIMSSAIVDAYQIAGSYLYATKYTDPGLQAVAATTYVPTYETIQLISTNPNIVTDAKAALINRYNETYENNRKGVSNALSAIDDRTKQSSVESGTSSEIATQQSERRTYLESMYGYSD